MVSAVRDYRCRWQRRDGGGRRRASAVVVAMVVVAVVVMVVLTGAPALYRWGDGTAPGSFRAICQQVSK